MRVLIVDDDTFICQLLTTYFQHHLPGVAVVVVGDGQSTLEQLKEQHFDAVLLDIQLPDISGYDVLRKIRQTFHPLALPVMMATSLSENGDVIQGFTLGANEFITKPLDLPVVIARIKNLLAARSAYMETSGNSLPSNQASHLATPARETQYTSPLAIRAATDAAITKTQVQPSLTCYVVIADQAWPVTVQRVATQQIVLRSDGALPTVAHYRLRFDFTDQTSFTVKVEEESREQLATEHPGAWLLHVSLLEDTPWLETIWQRLHPAVSTQSQAEPPADKGQARTLPVEHRYRLIKELGRGGFATVYLVMDLALKRQVAMKVLDSTYAASSRTRQHFLNEAQTVAQFDHPNIALVHEVNELQPPEYTAHLDFPASVLTQYPKGIIYFTMQYIDGENLAEYLARQRRVPAGEAVARLAELARALGYAHNKGVIHRDFKPQNILIQRNGRYVITDFGIAKLDNRLTGKDTAASLDEHMVCTPAYASPEQLAGTSVDARSDIYSFGLVAFELLSGQQAYTGNNLGKLLQQKRKQSTPHLLDICPDLDPQLVAVVNRCLASDPADRFADISAVLQALNPRTRDTAPTPGNSLQARTLLDLLQHIILSDTVSESAILLRKLTTLVILHQDQSDNPAMHHLIQHLRKPEVLDLLIDKNLNGENRDLLFQFLQLFAAQISIFVLLNRFQREKEVWKKEFLSKLAVIAAGSNLNQLSLFGLELPDENAVAMLRGLRATEPKPALATVYQRWSHHQGLKTQLEWLAQIDARGMAWPDCRDIVQQWSRGRGTTHRKVKGLAARILSSRTHSLEHG